jgi:hypothetical protein
MDPMPGLSGSQATAASAASGRIWSCPAENRVKVHGWRLMHAAVPCNAYAASRRVDVQSCCQAACCAARGRRRALDETYMHLYLECPEVSKAAVWLRDLWHALTGTRPPEDPAVLLGDLAARWPDYPPTESLQQLWTCLRLTLLFHIWRLRCQRRVGAAGAVAVVRATIASLRDSMQQRFYRVARVEDLYDRLPARLVVGGVEAKDLGGFTSVWCHGGVLCTVAAEPVTGRPHLTVLLTEQHPVVAPQENGP